MDIEFDSNLGEIGEAENIGLAERTFRPYLYEPVSRNQPQSSYDNEPTQVGPSFFVQFEDITDAVSDVSI